MYVALTVLLVYAGNLTEAELSRRRLVKLLGWLFVVTVAGRPARHGSRPLRVHLAGGDGCCRRHIRNKGFVQSLVHPVRRADHGPRRRRETAPGRAVGLHQHLGQQLLPAGRLAGGGRLAEPPRARRSSGPWSACWFRSCQRWSRSTGACGSASASWSLYVAARYVLAGKLWILGVVAMAGAMLAVALLATPLGGVVSARMDNGKSNGVRSFLIDRAAGRLHRLAGDRLRRHPQHARRPQLDHGRRERRLRAVRQLHGRRQRPAVATALRARRRRHRRLPRLLRVRPVAVPPGPQPRSGWPAAPRWSPRSPRCSGTTRWSPPWPSWFWRLRCSGATQ